MFKDTLRSSVAVGIVALVALVATGFLFFRSDRVPPSEGIPERERDLLLAPPTPEEASAYMQTLERRARASDTLTIGPGCVMEPMVLDLAGVQVLKVQNTDSTEHTLAFEGDTLFITVSPGEVHEVDIRRITHMQNGSWRYRCADLTPANNNGVLLRTASSTSVTTDVVGADEGVLTVDSGGFTELRTSSVEGVVTEIDTAGSYVRVYDEKRSLAFTVVVTSETTLTKNGVTIAFAKISLGDVMRATANVSQDAFEFSADAIVVIESQEERERRLFGAPPAYFSPSQQ